MENRETAGILDIPVVPTWPPDCAVFYVEAAMVDVRESCSPCKGVAAICA
jgi:hypothetical protein